ncbi:unnamed protein product [Rotaria sp. Silwood1]|nr:unnamed protein product [Rotaria sp. Silwood1]
MHSNMNNPDERRADTCDLPTLPMQLISLSTYPIHGPPPPYAMTPPLNPPLYSPPTVDITKTSEAYQSAIVPDDYIHLETVRIRDYMSWSLVNETYILIKIVKLSSDEQDQIQGNFVVE